MKNYFMIVAAASLLACFSPCGSKKEAAPETLKVINVLDAELYNDAHIKGSINIPDDGDAVIKAASNWGKSTPIVIYCTNYMCSASGAVARQLTALGYTNVWAYEGGMADWYHMSKEDPAYVVEGPAQNEIWQSMPKAHDKHDGVRVITAPELLKMMKEANLLQ